MILLDTSALVACLVGPRLGGPRLRQLLDSGERIAAPTLVLYEWWRGPRTAAELHAQEQVLWRDATLLFGPAEADMAAKLYRKLDRARTREIDICIAATAIVYDATLWTLNSRDFADIPGLRLL